MPCGFLSTSISLSINHSLHFILFCPFMPQFSSSSALFRKRSRLPASFSQLPAVHPSFSSSSFLPPGNIFQLPKAFSMKFCVKFCKMATWLSLRGAGLETFCLLCLLNSWNVHECSLSSHKFSRSVPTVSLQKSQHTLDRRGKEIPVYSRLLSSSVMSHVMPGT